VRVDSRNARAVSISTGAVPFMDVWAGPGRCPFLCLEHSIEIA
jgi:hypothetical protein